MFVFGPCCVITRCGELVSNQLHIPCGTETAACSLFVPPPVTNSFQQSWNLGSCCQVSLLCVSLQFEGMRYKPEQACLGQRNVNRQLRPGKEMMATHTHRCGKRPSPRSIAMLLNLINFVPLTLQQKTCIFTSFSFAPAKDEQSASKHP